MIETSPLYCFKSQEFKQKKREIEVNPTLQPLVNVAERVINKLRKGDEDIKEPIKNTREDGAAQSWHWVEISTPGLLAQSGLCLVLEPDYMEEVQMSVKTHIDDKRIEGEHLEWGRVVSSKNWRVEDLHNRPEQMDSFETTISNSLRESFEDLDDKEIIIIQYKKNLEKQSR